MRRSLATLCMSGTLRDKLEATAAARFDAVELCEPDFIGFRGTAREVRNIADDLGIGIDLYQPFRDIGGGVDTPLQQVLDRAERKFDLMGELGAPMMSVTSGTFPPAGGGPAAAAEQLQTLAERAARRNLRIAFEAAPSGRSVRTTREAWAIVQQAKHPHLGLLVDSFHMLSTGEEPADLREIPGNRLFCVRIGDARRPGWNGVRAGWHRNFPGQGELDIVSFLEHVLFTGFAGTISLASFSDVLRATPSRRTGIDAMRALLFLESQVRGRLEHARAESGSESSGAAATAERILDTVSLFDPPKPSRFSGVAFLEFCVRDDAAARLEELLQQLGFARYGRHRTKAVTLYRQGEIRLVVNADQSANARSRFSQEPASVCCLGLLAEHPGRAASRGRALLSTRQDSPRGAQELELPTIIAPGGTMLQFVPGQHVEADFVEETGRPASPSGLNVVDHVEMALTIEQLDTWILFTRSVLDLTPTESVDVAEPFGVIRGVGLANDNRQLRMLLNASVVPSPRQGALPESGKSGGTVDGIALGCDDIFAAVERLRSNGVSFVPISGNYYDDLSARQALDESTIERMRTLDIVFDRSASGTYFQAYTEAFDGRFHFQVVQRTGYDGYGAVNEPLRAAALEQLRQVEEWLQARF